MKGYLDILWRRKWVMISFFLAAVISATILNFIQKNVYRATATVIVDVDEPNYFAYRDYIQTQKEVIRSRRAAYHVIKNLNLAAQKEFKEASDPIDTLLKKVCVGLIRDTRILRITVEDEEPEAASRIANEFAMVYVDSNIALKAKISSEMQSWLKQDLGQQKEKVRDAEFKLMGYNTRVQDLAYAAQEPIRPKRKLNLILSIIAGILGGSGLVFLREYMDMSLREPGDMAALLQLTVLDSVPGINFDKKTMRNKSDIDRIVEKYPYSLISEAYRSIRTNLLFSLDDSNNATSIAITSSLACEGKTLTAVNMAILMANGGERVLLVDSNMRKPRIHAIFNDKNEAGFSQFLSGKNDFDSIVKPSGIDNLYFVTSGKTNYKSSGLILSKNINIFLEEAGSQFSKIIFDTAPVVNGRETAILSGNCNGVIVIIENSRAKEALLKKSKELLEKVNAKILGVIVNNTSVVKGVI